MISLGDPIKRHLTEVEERLTGKRFCTGCNKLQLAEGGVMRGMSRGKRWSCAACEHRRKHNILPGGER